jgi:hypothetical protein
MRRMLYTLAEESSIDRCSNTIGHVSEMLTRDWLVRLTSISSRNTDAGSYAT